MNLKNQNTGERQVDGAGVMFLLNSLEVGGSERKTVRLANALAADNRRVVIAYLSAPETLLARVDPAVVAVNLDRRGKFSVAALRKLVATLAEHDIGTLFALNLYSALYAVLAKSLCTSRRLRVAISVNTMDFATRKEARQMFIYRHVLRRAGLVVFGAERQRRQWSSRYGLDQPPHRTLVLYNGVDTDEFSRERVIAAPRLGPQGEVTLGTVGAFRVEKAQIDLVRAVHALSLRGVRAEAVVVGDGPERPHIEREIRRLGVEQQIRLIGTTDDVRPYLAAMDVFVLPSTAETFSNAVLEAMAMSCPVLVTAVGGMEEMLQFGGGLSYPPGDITSLCDLLVPLALNAEARKALGAQARDAAEKHFSFAKMLGDFGQQVLDSDWQAPVANA